MKSIKAQTKGLYKRNFTYYIRKVIPERLRYIAGKREFFISLRTDNYQEACERYIEIAGHIRYAIKSMKDGTYVRPENDTNYQDNQNIFEHYSKVAASNGRNLECFNDIVHNPSKVAELAANLQRAHKTQKLTKDNFRSFVNVKNAGVRVSHLIGIYLEAKKLDLKGLNKRERACKINPLINASNQFIRYMKKDILVSSITKSDARAFYKYLKDKLYDGDIKANTANKYLTHLRVLIKEYYQENDIDSENPFLNLRFAEEKNKRSALRVDYIKKSWLNNSVFEKTHPELKFMLWAMIDTGCGPKELCGLDPLNDICLNEEIPHIIIRKNIGRGIKTNYRDRRIPLVGLALSAFKMFPQGFQRYNNPNGPENVSAALNKFLNHNNLFESEEQTLYSTRHCMKDRLRAHNIPLELQDRIMGHKTEGMGAHYGNGYSLKQLYEAMLQVEGDFK